MPLVVKGVSPPGANKLMTPPSMVRPLAVVTATRSVVGPHSKERSAPSLSQSEPRVKVPAVVAVAGDKMPPALTVAATKVPVPAKVASALTVTCVLASAPFATNVPADTRVDPV